MQSIWIQRRGGPEVLEVRTGPVPEPAAGQVRIKVAAAGVNFADIMMRRGLYPDAPKLPAVPGYEVSGVVEAVGPHVDASLLGRPVVAMCRFGGYSERVCVPAGLVHEIPPQLDLVTGAALPVNYLTAWQMVRVMAPPAEGETVLIHSAAGGVGMAAIQLCRLSGARILASASASKHEFLRGQGIDHVFDSRREDFAAAVKAATGGRGADVILEPRHGRWIAASHDALARCGRLILFGFSSAARGRRSGVWSALGTLARVPWLRINPVRLMNDNKMVGGVNLGRMWDQGPRIAGWMRALLDLAAAGDIAPVIDSVHPFSRAADAHDRLELRQNIGKVLLTPDPEDTA